MAKKRVLKTERRRDADRGDYLRCEPRQKIGVSYTVNTKKARKTGV